MLRARVAEDVAVGRDADVLGVGLEALERGAPGHDGSLAAATWA